MPRASSPKRFGAGDLIACLPVGRSTVVISLDGCGADPHRSLVAPIGDLDRA